MKQDSHGGNIYKKARELGLREEDILDYSANISPLGLPEHIKNAMIDAIAGTVNYPDPECTELREAIAGADGVEPAWIACGNGGADLLYRLAFGLLPKKALLPTPAFVEYEEALAAAGTQMVYYKMGEDLRIHEDILEMITDDVDLVILCNPNNPTGIRTQRELVLAIAEKAKEKKAAFLVDECFLEICRDEDAYTVRPFLSRFPNLMILKSFTKLYAMPGVRLGYLLCADAHIIERLNRAGQAWSVSHIAQKAGVAALSHPEYKEKVIAVVEEELLYMKEALRPLPLILYEGAANYLFFRTPGCTDLDRRLERRGILIRNCSNYVNLTGDCWRVAVKSHLENVRLLAALREALCADPEAAGGGAGAK